MFLKKVLITTRNLTRMQISRSYASATKVNIKGQTINYLKVGQGNKVLLAWPGALGTIWSDFKPQIDGLDKEKFTLVVWDPPGYGGSRPPERKFPIDFLEKDAHFGYDLMKELKIPRYSLLGWSDGGISSMILAAKYPDVVEKLVIWGSNAYVGDKDIEAYNKVRDLSKWSDKMKAPLIELYGEKGMQALWYGWGDAIMEVHAKGGNLCKELVPKIKCPTFILHGDKDPMVPYEHVEYLMSNLKGAKLHRFKDGKHNIHLRYADEFNKVITEFLLGKSNL